MSSRSGFVAVLGRPNAGKSTFLNFLCGENLALVSHKANATRKRMNFIITHQCANQEKAQIIFVDTPGIHKQEKLLNQFMLQEALKAMGDCDLNLFLSPVYDDLKYYKEFLALCNNKPHILLLSQCDKVSKQEVLEKISEYQKFQDKFLALIPIECKEYFDFSPLLEEIIRHLPYSPFLYDEEIMTTSNMREIYKEIIRESLFEKLSDEIPYESDVVIERFAEEAHINRVFAKIIVEKESQKAMIIGKNASTIKRIGKNAREKIEMIEKKKIFLKLNVFAQKNWSKTKEGLKKIGYDFDF
ncbi:GTPase Era [Helicobacter kayseriensis]|uniref:GTPase Era n=1 Tax=Helicobacter kayseriensis TaxID=2905877 RepID=UPI001E504772|nr:GTPase Era [Helicobacter kayseriensis]MCE3046787.1 GTPase Era [Helicobacter kayseriensis]MCE3047911.1 GTPase Era [Helicobacter kayseriensis]